ncbi:MAG TPA: hypothetical protein VGC67_04155 [Cellulomonas sp.]
MGPVFEHTPGHERIVELIGATQRLVPRRSREIPGWSAWQKGEPLPADRYGDGGTADDYGPQPSTA